MVEDDRVDLAKAEGGEPADVRGVRQAISEPGNLIESFCTQQQRNCDGPAQDVENAERNAGRDRSDRVDEIDDPAVPFSPVDPDLEPAVVFHLAHECVKSTARIGQVVEHSQRIGRVERAVLQTAGNRCRPERSRRPAGAACSGTPPRRHLPGRGRSRSSLQNGWRSPRGGPFRNRLRGQPGPRDLRAAAVGTTSAGWRPLHRIRSRGTGSIHIRIGLQRSRATANELTGPEAAAEHPAAPGSASSNSRTGAIPP